MKMQTKIAIIINKGREYINKMLMEKMTKNRNKMMIMMMIIIIIIMHKTIKIRKILNKKRVDTYYHLLENN
jgi:hypothetical protein